MAGANLVVVGNGKPEQIGPLAKESGFIGPIVTDQARTSYLSLGFRRGVSGLISLNAVVAGVKAFGSGYRQAGVHGDALQLGGIAIIGSGPTLHYIYRSEKAADHPPVSDVLRECSAAVEQAA